MHEFRVWAPGARKLSVKVGDVLSPMNGPDEHGWWSARVDAAHPGADYAFVLNDNAVAFPDPRSAWQPSGVHGPSRLYDHSAFRWNDGGWKAPPLARAVIYELHIGTFTAEGTFDAAIDRLDYLAELGITHLELMPLAEFPGRFGWGYDGAALFAVAQKYGGPDSLKRLVDACHHRGLAVLLDVVYNHFGPVGSYATSFAPYLTKTHNTPWGDAVNFEGAGSDEVRRFFCDNALMWLRDYHLDGLRLDAVHAFVDRSSVHFMEQLSTVVESFALASGRRLVVIAESDLNDPRFVTPLESGGYGMDAQWNDDFHHALFTVLNPNGHEKGYYADFGSLAMLAKSLTKMFVYDGVYSRYRSHSHGRPVKRLSAHSFIGFIQNHDQVGNRAIGDRLASIVGIGRAKVAAGVVMTSPAIPLIFQGEEFAASTPFQYFADHDEPGMAKAVSEGRKREFAAFGWDPAAIPEPGSTDTFSRSKLHWSETREGRHHEMLEWYRALIHLRRASHALNDGDLRHISVQFDEDRRWLLIDRGPVKTLLNLGTAPAEFDVEDGFHLMLASREDVTVKQRKIVLPPDTLAIVSSEQAGL
ncbi:malto-oligosyltrehalose trehalohydrolase [Edaphobacter sp.]|uniref:malto-oligosyltrehalose trehalohydrolase n=1 Tax=Edaphobacter sp. TaxID=1934404 RepID=UPI002DB799D7|nr:malto-oligosyltrehalose trehalohydrolase [Edaphobacter sp.]HEU5340670.1 malto-oligosyltrehalose trehalohydrolase [Edaphobacter sp.]